MAKRAEIIHTDLKPENIMIELGEDSMGKFIEDVSKITVKPMSMKFFKNIQKSNQTKNSKKNKKKKAAKAKAKVNE